MNNSLSPIQNINLGAFIQTREDFNLYVNFFLSDNLKNERMSLYMEKMNNNNLESLAEAKHEILKQLFSTYIQNSLTNSNNSIHNNEVLEAKKNIDELVKLRNVFKNHDVVDYKEFISESDSKITDTEVELLFLEPVLNKNELARLTNAFVKAFSNKYIVSNTKSDFQSKFFNHPLINCLDGYSDFSKIKTYINKDTIELGHYKNLIEAILKLKEKVHSEEYQGFITYVIKEDLTFGFSKILKNSNYKPESLRKLLQEITLGHEVDNQIIQDVIREIKNEHTRNLALNEKKELQQNISSQFSLNDYGFDLNINGKSIFFHGHATENSGGNQKGQQANTSYNLREHNKDSIGLTVFKNNVTRTDHHRTFLRDYKLSELVNFTKTEEVIITGLQLDAANLKALNLLNNSIENWKNSDFLSSNNYIVKSEIEKSVDLVNNNLGKNDFDLIIEKKNSYLYLLGKNKDLFKSVLDLTSTENELSYQLLANPLTEFIQGILEMEEVTNTSLFNEMDLILLKDLFSTNTSNIDLKTSMKKCLKMINNRNSTNYNNIEIDKYQSLINLGQLDKEVHTPHFLEISIPKDIIKYLKNSQNSLSECLSYIENNPFEKQRYAKKTITTINKLLAKKINSKTDSLLLHYRVDKRDNLVENIESITQYILDKKNVDFNMSDYQSLYSHDKTLAQLLKPDNTSSEGKQNDMLILSALVCLAQNIGSTIKCGNNNLKQYIKLNN